MKLIIAGGGTGGHIFPAMAIAEEFKDRDKDSDILFVGAGGGMEGRILPEAGWPVRFITAGSVKGKGLAGKVEGLIKTIAGAVQSVGIIRSFGPSFVLGVGGYCSAPMALAGVLMKVKTAIHEQNAMPGFANRLLGKIVDKVFVTYSESGRFFKPGKVEVTGNPVRKDIIHAARSKGRPEGQKKRFTVLVFGGSQGARRINEVVTELFCGSDGSLAEISVIHQTGERDCEWVREAYQSAGINAEVSPFIKDMASVYGAADLVICRAGATAISELLAAGKPSILVPYPYAADDHQRSNAETIVKGGAARMIPDSELSAGRLSDEIDSVREKLTEIGMKARQMADTDGAKRVCDEILKMVVEEM